MQLAMITTVFPFADKESFKGYKNHGSIGMVDAKEMFGCFFSTAVEGGGGDGGGSGDGGGEENNVVQARSTDNVVQVGSINNVGVAKYYAGGTKRSPVGSQGSIGDDDIEAMKNTNVAKFFGIDRLQMKQLDGEEKKKLIVEEKKRRSWFAENVNETRSEATS